MAGLSRAIPCPFRMPPAWPAGVGSQAKQKFVVTYTSPFTPTPVLIQICSGARCYSRLRCGVGLLQIYYERHRNVYKGKGRRLYMNRELAIRRLRQQILSYEEAFWVVMDEM